MLRKIRARMIFDKNRACVFKKFIAARQDARLRTFDIHLDEIEFLPCQGRCDVNRFDLLNLSVCRARFDSPSIRAFAPEGEDLVLIPNGFVYQRDFAIGVVDRKIALQIGENYRICFDGYDLGVRKMSLMEQNAKPDVCTEIKNTWVFGQ